MRAAFQWVRHAFELAGAVMLASAGIGIVVGAAVAGVMSIPWPFRVLVFAGVLLIVAAALLAGWAALQRRRQRRLARGPRLAASARDVQYVFTGAETGYVTAEVTVSNPSRDDRLSAMVSFTVPFGDGTAVEVEPFSQATSGHDPGLGKLAEQPVNLGPQESFKGTFAAFVVPRVDMLRDSIGVTVRDLISGEVVEAGGGTDRALTHSRAV